MTHFVYCVILYCYHDESTSKKTIVVAVVDAVDLEGVPVSMRWPAALGAAPARGRSASDAKSLHRRLNTTFAEMVH